MPTSLSILYVVGGGIWLVMGGDWLVRGAIALARKAGISPMVVGLTVVAFGTSAPELVVSVRAALLGFPELAIGNVVGSNIANVLLVMGLPAMIYPMACDQEGVSRDGLFMLATSVLFFALCTTGDLGRVDGMVLLVGLVVFGAYVFRSSTLRELWTQESREMPRILGLPTRPWLIALLLVAGGLALPVGAQLLIQGAVGVAETLGVPNAVMGLTLVAVSTSLPELATTMVAAFKRESEVAVGNILGSNILNLLAIMGAAALVSPLPIPVSGAFLRLDLPAMLVAAAALTVLTTRKATVGRVLGGLLVLGYLAYTLVLFGTPR